jgi:cytochrome c oxidase subunit 3
MTTAPTVIAGSPGPPHDGSVPGSQIGLHDLPAKLGRYRLGVALYIVSVVMLFVGFSSAYVVRRGIPTFEAATGAYSTQWEPLHLPVELLLVNTLLLLGSSVALENSRRRSRVSWASREEQKGSILGWILLSLSLSLGFIMGQGIAWHMLRSDGHFLASGARTAFFYILSGTHAFHAIVGIALLAWIVLRQRPWLPARRFLAVDLIAWYLHAMTALWIYLFAFLTFA